MKIIDDYNDLIKLSIIGVITVPRENINWFQLKIVRRNFDVKEVELNGIDYYEIKQK